MDRILLVDDEKGIMFAISAYFKRRGFAVDCAADPEAARLFLSERTYKLAIVDVHLSGRSRADGLDLAEMICRERPQTPVIVMTALATPENQLRAASIGVSSFLSKPARLSEVAELAFGLVGGPAPAAL
jgi:two-component system nitrogen regulation response regulator GlnG